MKNRKLVSTCLKKEARREKVGKVARRIVAPLAAGLLLLPACAGTPRGTRAAPDPVEVRRTVSEENDWFRAANIIEASDFRIWEPIAREISGREPIPSERVSLVSDEELRAICSNEAGGCFRPGPRDIFIGEGMFREGISQQAGIRYRDHCRVMPGSIIEANSRLEVWAHEQGHSFDGYLGHNANDKWANEIEAEAFVMYLGEHIARHYDARIGISLIHNALVRTGDPAVAEDAFRELVSRQASSARDTTLGNISVSALMGTGFQSFGEMWYYVHGHRHSEVLARVRANIGRIDEGFDREDEIMRSLAGVEREYPGSFDMSPFSEFALSEHSTSYRHPRWEETSIDNGIQWVNEAGWTTARYREEDGNRTLEISTRRGVGRGASARQEFINRIRGFSGSSIFRLTMRRSASGVVSLEFVGPDRVDPINVLGIPDTSASRAMLVTNSNPLNLSFCFSSSREIEVNPQEYVATARHVLSVLRGNLEQGEGEDAQWLLDFLERKERLIFGE
ncbi:MAG: hypothetical protein ABII71_05210 [Candidatus Micrarchaeota archaeon]